MRAVTPGGRDLDAPAPADERQRAAAFGAIVAAHTDRLCHYVYRYVRSREVAEDIVQEVFIRLWERGDDGRIRDPLPYLYQAAHNRAISHLRHEHVHERWQSHAVLVAEPRGDEAQADLEHGDLARALDGAIALLPDRCRQVFLLSREQGMTHAEIARLLGVSIKTVESHVWRALTTLRARVAAYL